MEEMNYLNDIYSVAKYIGIKMSIGIAVGSIIQHSLGKLCYYMDRKEFSRESCTPLTQTKDSNLEDRL